MASPHLPALRRCGPARLVRLRASSRANHTFASIGRMVRRWCPAAPRRRRRELRGLPCTLHITVLGLTRRALVLDGRCRGCGRRVDAASRRSRGRRRCRPPERGGTSRLALGRRQRHTGRDCPGARCGAPEVSLGPQPTVAACASACAAAADCTFFVSMPPRGAAARDPSERTAVPCSRRLIGVPRGLAIRCYRRLLSHRAEPLAAAAGRAGCGGGSERRRRPPTRRRGRRCSQRRVTRSWASSPTRRCVAACGGAVIACDIISFGVDPKRDSVHTTSLRRTRASATARRGRRVPTARGLQLRRLTRPRWREASRGRPSLPYSSRRSEATRTSL